MHAVAMLPFLTGGTATAAAGAGAAAAAGGGFSLSAMLAGGAGVVSGLASLAKGSAEGTALESSALFEEFNGKQELLRGRSEALEVARAANEAIAAAQVAGFASGLAGSGSVTRAKESAMEDAEFQIGMTRSAAAMQAGARRGSAARMRSEATGARRASLFTALGSFASGASRFAETG